MLAPDTAGGVREIVVGVVTGVLSAAITGIIPFVLQLRWRRADHRGAQHAAWQASTEKLRGIVGQCAANHKLHHIGGRHSNVIIMQNMPAMIAEASIIAAGPFGRRGAEVRRLVEEYCRPEDYKQDGPLALKRAEGILRYCASFDF